MAMRSKWSLLFANLALCGCATFPANPGVTGLRVNPHPSGEEETLRGVVNGLWKFDPARTLARMSKYEEHLTPQEISEYSQRYIVRVGIRKAPPFKLLSPVPLSSAAEFVVLPAAWSHDPFVVSGRPEIINVGDVVEIRTQHGRYYDFLVAIVRQCDALPVEGERKEWALGCKTYRAFDESGYAGVKYRVRTF